MRRILFCSVLLVVVVSCNALAESGPYMYLGEIVVYGKRKAGNAVATVTELTSEDMKTRGDQNIAQAMESIPGADVQIGSKGEKRLVIRGFRQSELKVLIDGVPAYEGYFGTVDLEAIPTESIEKIVVTKGASSVLYGANTMGGVVNIVTKKGGEIPKTNVSCSFGDYNTQEYVLGHSGQQGKINYYLGASRRVSDGLRLSDKFDKTEEWVGEDSEYREDGERRESSAYEKHSVTANIGYKADETSKTKVSLSWFSQNRGCPTSVNRYWRFANWDQWQLSLASDKRLNSKVRLRTRYFYVGHTDEVVDDAERTVAAGGTSWFDKSMYDDCSVGGEIHSHLDLGGWSLVRAGVSYQKDRHKEKEYNAKEYTARDTVIVPGWGEERTYEADTYCIGAEASLTCTDRLSFTLGCSYNGYVPVESADMPRPGKTQILTPQAGADYDIGENLTIYGSVGKRIRFPRMKELYSEHVGGNPSLQAEQTIASEIGIKQNTGVTNVYVSFFDNNITNLVERTRDSAGNWIYVNVGEAHMYGVETEVHTRISDRLDVTGNYTYLRAWNEADDCEIEQRPSHKLNSDIRYSFPFGLSVSLQGVYVGEQKVYYDKGENVRTAQDYTLINMKLSQKLNPTALGSPELFLLVNNMTDRNYEEGNGPMPGRGFLAGLNLLF